jgi:hypothetical protein
VNGAVCTCAVKLSLFPSLLAVSVAEPGDSQHARPAPSTVATASLLELNVTVRLRGWFASSAASTSSVTQSPAVTGSEIVVSVTWSTGGMTRRAVSLWSSAPCSPPPVEALTVTAPLFTP